MTDFVYNQTTVGLFQPQLWLTLEPDMAIICACLPVLRPLITMVLASPVYRSIASHLTVGRSSISSEGAGTGSGSGSNRHRKHAALNTIGGSTAPGGRAGRGQSHHAREKSQGSDITKNTLSSFESLEYLGVEDVEAGRLVPETNGRVWSWHGDPSIGHQAQVSRSQSVALDEVPMDAISVKTVVDCTETTGESHQLPAS